ncbi:MAG: N(G),N(G)-dimethylarginine dimethylaminohydrolase, partial [Fidelibacterota bacterium]
MMKFTHAITRRPCKNIIKGLTKAGLGIPNYELAVQQHEKYCEVLENCGLTVTILDPDENFPDSTFVEDTAVLTSECAVIARPGAE